MCIKERSNGRVFSLLRPVAMTAALTSMVLLPSIGVTGTNSSVTAEEILKILKDKGIVTEQQYSEIVKKAEEEKVEQEKEYTVAWKNGVRIDRNDGKFKVKIGGRIHFDWGMISPDSSLEANEDADVYGTALEGDGAEFRRARIYISGTLYEDLLFKAQYDFAGGDVDWRDVYLGMKNIPVLGQVLVGQMKEPFSLEELTSSNNITFMERSLPTGTFSPSRNTGFRASNAIFDKRMTWAAGVFYGDTDDDGDSEFDDTTNIDATLRLTGVPYYEDDGRRLLHLGLGLSHQFRDEGETTIRYRSRPESHLGSARLVDTGAIDVDSADLINPEVAVVWGPVSLQGEYFFASLDASDADDPSFQGAYVYGSWFITGENRSYSRSSGRFGRVTPNSSFADGGIGAWEVGARWSWVDLNDEDISGGEQNNFTLGLNWYATSNYRVMLNYVYADVEDFGTAEDGNANIFQARFQVDF